MYATTGSNPFSTYTLGTGGGGTWGNPTINFPTTPVFNPNLTNEIRALLNQTTGGANTGGVKITTPQMQSGQTTLDKVLATFLSAFAIQKQAAYVPTTTQPNQGYGGQMDAQTLAYLQQQQLGGTGATFGASIEQFVTNNTGLILIGGIAFVLFKSGRK